MKTFLHNVRTEDEKVVITRAFDGLVSNKIEAARKDIDDELS